MTPQIHYETEIAGPLHDRKTDAYAGRISTETW